ncbi:dTDP-6-deoxy-L-talose 4-dehydrogenase (NAD(P)(+)) [Streptomyces sp. RB5]|uniref:dTDP-6-deoxy-L-talose 4-dehydrogenase (NAD(P)(+)) n=1 Tax=Streptomyces smaragdinus TaxID=2585196 RepID=A0A7K0CFS3_9ACTN|nr:dTDP-6-deoxy-L-talose 4-dehydrogenase (NAD(P)(+)) [Streptomyces smaragdinus]
MRVVLLGSSGWLGGYVLDELAQDREVIPVPRGTVELGVTGVGDLAGRLASLAPDAVVNCAGRVGGDALGLIGANARGPAVLCAALSAAAPRARLVHLGSAAEYGAVAGRAPLTEDAPTCPQGLYGASKLAGSLAVAGSPLDAVVLRVFNAVGPGAPPTSLPGRLVRGLREAGADGVVRTGALTAARDYVDPRDVARAVALALGRATPRVLNVAGGRAVPVRDVADGLAEAAGFRGRIEESGGGPERSAFVDWQQADVSAAGAALGWRAEVPLVQSLKDLWADDPGPAPRSAAE